MGLVVFWERDIRVGGEESLFDFGPEGGEGVCEDPGVFDVQDARTTVGDARCYCALC